ncbi:MAG: hypothetical protein CMJ46_08635 [Planctomyces sp.]|nr:hypothetical protein [Planctomyces sp.]
MSGIKLDSNCLTSKSSAGSDSFRAGAFRFCMMLSTVLLGLIPANSWAQSNLYYPLDQYAPTGRAAHWSSFAVKPRMPYMQPVRVHLPSEGSVMFYGAHPQTESAPAIAGLFVSQVYRLKLADMPEFPGVSLYPTIEMLDRLHPPEGEELAWPLEIEVSAEEVAHVIDGGLVTKVIYLEQPQLAIPVLQETASPTHKLPEHYNLIKEADRLGRPMALFRMGSRQPAMDNPASTFFTPDSWVTRLPQQPVEGEKASGIAHAVSEEIETISEHQRIYKTNATSRVSLKQAPHGLSERMSRYELYPDEYIVDGGDRNYPVHYENRALAGLDSEDTVAEYQNEFGGNELTVSNKVVIYSPRFRSLSVHQLPFSRTALTKIGGLHDRTTGVGMEQSMLIDTRIQKSQLDGMRTRSRGSELEVDAAFSGLFQNTYTGAHTKLENVYEDLQFTKAGRFERMNKVDIQLGLQGAFTWSQDSFPIITASTSAGNALESSFRPAEIVGVELDKGKPGKLRIVKLADKVEAKPGEIITFTIRFDNMGDHTVRDIKITDHLTPRLEFIEGSFQAERQGEVRFFPNSTVDSILRFEMAGELKGGEGSVLTFQARVR